MVPQILDRRRNRVRKQDVVRVEVADDLAVRPSEALVDRGSLPCIGLREPAHTVSVTPEDGESLVRGTAVDDEVLDVRVRLAEDAVDGASDEAPLVEGRRDDRDE